jgi:tetraspanin-13/31
MVILFLLFVIQFIIGSVCLALSYHVKSDYLQMGWDKIDNGTKNQIENQFDCCGFKNATERMPDCTSRRACFEVLEVSMEKALRMTGAISLTFSFLQVINN